VLRTCCRKRMQTAYCGSRQQDPIISSLATPQLSRAVTRVSPHAATMANKDAAPADSDTVTWHMQCRLSKLPMANCTQLQGCHVQGYWPQHSTAQQHPNQCANTQKLLGLSGLFCCLCCLRQPAAQLLVLLPVGCLTILRAVPVSSRHPSSATLTRV
jgi:hypothetical protein